MARRRATPAVNPLAKALERDAIVERAIGRMPMAGGQSEPPFATQQMMPSMPNAPGVMNIPGSFGRSATTLYAGLAQDPQKTLELQYLDGLDHGIPDRHTPNMTAEDKAAFRSAQANYEAQHMQPSGQSGPPGPDQDQSQNQNPDQNGDQNQPQLSPLADRNDRRM